MTNRNAVVNPDRRHHLTVSPYPNMLKERKKIIEQTFLKESRDKLTLIKG